jgi:hypothetical protein
MTRYENIKQMSKEDLGHYLCNLIGEVAGRKDCNVCPAYYLCFIGHNGMVEWLDGEEQNDG